MPPGLNEEAPPLRFNPRSPDKFREGTVFIPSRRGSLSSPVPPSDFQIPRINSSI